MRPKKSLGQNFLIDPNYKRKIIDAISHHDPETLLEIGPGRGVLTEGLANIGVPLLLVEKDRDLGRDLQDKFSTQTHVTVWIGDFLDYSLSEFLPKATVVGNLPYNVASQIFIRLLEKHKRFIHLFLMFQKEMAVRFVAKPGTKHYGLLTLWATAYTEAEILFHLPPTVFKPQPKVDSSFVHFKVREKPLLLPEDENNFWLLMRKLFQQRRKTVRAVLKQMGVDFFGSISNNLPLNVRAETLGFEQLLSLSRLISSQN